jgi:hypothetical protein
MLLPACLRVLSQSCERGSQLAQAGGVGVDEKLIAVFRQFEGE